MPELPEVQTVVNDLRSSILDNKITDVVVLYKKVWKTKSYANSKIKNALIKAIERKGKNILLDLSNGYSLVFHLKMTGKMLILKPKSEVSKHTHVILKFPNIHLHFNDVRKFGYIDLLKTGDLGNAPYLSRLGPDPFEISEEDFVSTLKRKNRMIKALLLDQHIVSGLGNIYCDESLFDAGIHPKTVSSRISKKRLRILFNSVKHILRSAINNRGSSVSDYVDSEGEKGSFQNLHKVYGKKGKPCPVCGKIIIREIIGGRSSHYCSRCQKK